MILAAATAPLRGIALAACPSLLDSVSNVSNASELQSAFHCNEAGSTSTIYLMNSFSVSIPLTLTASTQALSVRGQNHTITWSGNSTEPLMKIQEALFVSFTDIFVNVSDAVAGIHVSYSKLSLSNAQVFRASGNHDKLNSYSCLLLLRSDLIVDKSLFYNCQSILGGGAVSASQSSSIQVTSSVFDNNFCKVCTCIYICILSQYDNAVYFNSVFWRSTLCDWWRCRYSRF